jgi:hypothetical protein
MINEVEIMGSLQFPTHRAVVVVALIVSLGFGGICPCEAQGTTTLPNAGKSLAVNSAELSCCSRGAAGDCRVTEHCNCSSCGCRKQIPQKPSEPVAPPTEDEREQTQAHPTSFAITTSTVVTCELFDSASSSSSLHTLVAQRTRFNI